MGKMKFFDTNGNNNPDANKVRLYDSGQGYEVECATCHDPYGVMNPDGATFIAGFLRVNDVQSALCLTCHAK